MRAVVQRVRWAEVEVDGEIHGRIAAGLLVYVGVATCDTPSEAARLAEKVAHLRIFEDPDGKLNVSLRDVRGDVLAIPNFTLLADARRGHRPAFAAAARGSAARTLFDAFADALAQTGVQVAKGVFGAHMVIRSAACGPVNIILELPSGEPAKADPDGGT
ncbi:MAG TPA: D-aminoacyl-tRNA deacylase [Phycisphaerae bacterium]|nr:D-aminoacyl-tRNA deacylase [Phycisphaerae bacterium]